MLGLLDAESRGCWTKLRLLQGSILVRAATSASSASSAAAVRVGSSPAAPTGWGGGRARPLIVVIVADAADRADGIFGPRTDPDHPGSSSTLTTKGDVDAQCPQERLRTT
jgi:hypothetical protein